MTKPLLPLLILATVAGCTTFGGEPKPEATAPTAEAATARKAEQDAAQGIKAYENGQYKEAQQYLKSALDGGLAAKADQLAAWKYLAFIACANRQKEVCKGHFRKALAIDPRFELTPAEAGHPLWGSVFKAVKAEKKAG